MSQNQYCDFCSSKNHWDRLAIIQTTDITQHLNCQDRATGFTLLHLVVTDYEESLFDILISQPNIDLNIYDAQHMTPLLLAIEWESNQLALRLVERGCDITRKDKNGTTPLMYAVKCGDVDLAFEILKRGLDVNEQDEMLCTALHYSCWNMTEELLDLLFYFGADPRIRNDSNETFFMCFLKIHRPDEDSELVEFQKFALEFEDNMNEINIRGISTLFLAIKYETPLLEEIIKRGADINYYCEDLNALHLSLETSDSTAFDLIWPKFDYNHIYSVTNIPLLCNFFHNITRSDWLHCFNIVCNSNAVQHYVSQNLPPLVSEIVKAFLRRRHEENDFFPYVCAVLSFGANVCLKDLETIYIYCGDNNDTMNFLLDMDIRLEETEFISHPYIMLNVAHHPRDIFNEHEFSTDVRKIAEQIKFLPTLFQYCTPTERFLTQLHLIPDQIAEGISEEDDSVDTNFRKEVCTAYKVLIELLTTYVSPLPSLVELCRNAVRESTCSRFDIKHYSHYQKVLHCFSLPKRILDTLLFKAPISNFHLNIPEVDLNDFYVHWSLDLYSNY